MDLNESFRLPEEPTLFNYAIRLYSDDCGVEKYDKIRQPQIRLREQLGKQANERAREQCQAGSQYFQG